MDLLTRCQIKAQIFAFLPLKIHVFRVFLRQVCDDPVKEALDLAETLCTSTSSAAVRETILTLRSKQEQGLEVKLLSFRI